MRKKDPAEIETDRIIAEIEKRIRVEYAQAQREILEKFLDYCRRYHIKDDQWNKWVNQGKKTKDEYHEWVMGQLYVSKRWNDMIDTISQDLLNANKIARSIATGYKPEVYAINHNYATFQVERDSLIDTSYTLYSRETVERIFRDNPQMLPPPGKTVSKKIAEGSALKWNNRHIQSVALQAVLQGNSIPDIAQRLANTVCSDDERAAVRNARTMMTGIQNAGRLDAYRRASAMGIENEKEWIATLDDRTRHAHRELDGETMPLDEEFVNEIGGIMFPGDPDAAPSNVWACRCTLVSRVKGWDDIAGQHRSVEKLDGQTYEEWKEEKRSSSKPLMAPKQTADNIRAGFIREYREVDGGWVGSGFKKNLEVDTAKADRSILVDLERSGITKNPVSMLERPLSPEESIKKVSGGDTTTGSCTSVAFCYAGNRNGFNARDFRGGASAKFFADEENIKRIVSTDGVRAWSQLTRSPVESAKWLAIDNVEEGKEYILVAGRHTAVIRQGSKPYTFEYLELQSRNNARNTWHDLTSRNMEDRFSCSDSSNREEWICIVDMDSLANHPDFRDILGYINTLPGNEMKGESGEIK